MNRTRAVILTAIVFSLLAVSPASATVYTGTSGSNSASLNVQLGGGNTVSFTLLSTTADALIPADLLTGVFFKLPVGVVLTPVSAVLGAGASVRNGTTDPGGVVGGEFAYACGGPTFGPIGTGCGISSSGLGLFGGPSFPGTNLAGPPAVDGSQYAMVSTTDNAATGNPTVLGETLIVGAVVFNFTYTGNMVTTGLGTVFQLGTDLAEPSFGCDNCNDTNVPEPATMAMVGLAGLALAAVRKRRAFTSN